MKEFLKVVKWGLGFAVIGAVPGAVLGIITGLTGGYLVAAIAGGLLFFLVYPASRRKWGPGADAITYFLAVCGGTGGGLACYYVGSLVSGWNAV